MGKTVSNIGEVVTRITVQHTRLLAWHSAYEKSRICQTLPMLSRPSEVLNMVITALMSRPSVY